MIIIFLLSLLMKNLAKIQNTTNNDVVVVSIYELPTIIDCSEMMEGKHTQQ